MVGGWDKSPGPDNDYASRPLTLTGKLALVLIAAVFVAIAYLLT